MKQKTIFSEINFVGVGQHKGLENKIKLSPAEINRGIVFNLGGIEIPLSIENVFGEGGYTTIGDKKGVYLKTIEHLLSAIAGCGIDNLVISSESDEVPILDGSALVFFDEILKIGLVEQNAIKKVIRVLKEVSYDDGKGAIVSLSPYDKETLNLDVEIQYPDISVIGVQKLSVDLNIENYHTLVAPARTFARMSDVEFLHSKGLCLGATLNSGIAVDENGILNPEGLRMEREFVAHKILDAIGDLFTNGMQVIGKYRSLKGGHTQNNQLMKLLLSNSSNYIIEEL